MSKVGNEGLVVHSWDDLSELSTDKLIKLRDVATDNVHECAVALEEARTSQIAIIMELSKRA